jgi:hypothetical protein
MSDKSAAEHIAQMLEESAAGYTIGTDLSVSKEYPSPNNLVTVYDSSTGPPSNVYSGNLRYEYLTVQIIVRRESNRDAMNDAYDIVDHLDYRTGDVKDGLNYTGIILMSGPAFMDYDEKNRARVSMNFRVQRY